MAAMEEEEAVVVVHTSWTFHTPMNAVQAENPASETVKNAIQKQLLFIDPRPFLQTWQMLLVNASSITSVL